jgi:hypothetical protein
MGSPQSKVVALQYAPYSAPPPTVRRAIPRLKSRIALTTVYHDKAHDVVGTQHGRQLARQCARSAT